MKNVTSPEASSMVASCSSLETLFPISGKAYAEGKTGEWPIIMHQVKIKRIKGRVQKKPFHTEIDEMNSLLHVQQ